MSRLACLRVPLFPLAARLRSEPELLGEAAAVFQGNGHAARIAAATRRARRGGIRPGMTLPQARALIPKLCLRPRDAVCERAARQALVEVAEGFSPRVEDAGEGVVYLDLAGLERHFGAAPRGRRTTAGDGGDTPPEDGGWERQMGRALAAAAEHAGLPAWVGIASSKLAARIAAEDPASPTVVAVGREAAYLAPLPLGRLAPEAAVTETLGRWGIRSIGEFARLPANRVASRLGADGQRLHEKARGLDHRPIVPRAPHPTFLEGLELDWPLVAIEPFLFVARTALERLVRRLEAQALACARLDLAMRLEPQGHHERSITFPAPTRDTKTLLTLLRLDLERQPPGAPVVGFTLTGWPDRPREAQLTLFGPTALSPDRLATTLARLFALLGPDGAGAPAAVDGHLPERAALVAYSPPPPPDDRPEPPPARGLLAVRVLRPPVPLEVLTAPAAAPDARAAAAAGHRRAAQVAEPPPDGDRPRPVRIAPATGEADAKRPRIAGRVRVASGPWALEQGWWTGAAVERDYWDVELTDGGLYRLYRDRASGDWFADGVYD